MMGKNENGNPGSTVIRILIVGDRNVGKSALVVRFLTRRFIGEYASGVEMTYKQEVNFAGVSISTEILDSFVSKNEEDLTRVVSKCDACVIVYDISDRNSFEFANSVATRMRCDQNPASRDSLTPILLVGNKSDLEHLREVGVQEGRRAADKIGSCHFSESSAAESFTEVQKVFATLFQLVNNSTTPSSGHKRRKKSLTHVKQMILDHYRRPPLGSRSLSLDGMAPLVTSSTPQPPPRPPKPVVTSSKDVTKYQTLPSKCRSLGTLSEHPAEAEEGQRSSGRVDRVSRGSRRSERVWWRRHKEGSSPDSRVSSTTTDASLSDFSAADDDAFVATSNVTSPTATSSRPIKRKNLKIRLPANSDGESLEDDDDDDVTTPPNSAPLILNNSRFRFNDVISSTDDVITDAEKRSPTQRLLKIFFKSGSDVTRSSRHDVIDSKPMFIVGSEEEDRVSCNDVMMTSSEASRFKRKDRRRSSLREAVGDIMRMRRKNSSNDNSRLF